MIPKHVLPYLLICHVLVVNDAAWAFDDDKQINKVNLSPENFLDIKAYSFRKSLQYQWFDALSGWRINGGSLDGDRSYVFTDLKLQQELSKYINARLEIQQEVFYATKPSLLPLLELEVFPWAKIFGVSLLGTAAHDKRQSDLGFALTYGRRPWNYIRYSWLSVDHFYNEKNDFDESYYTEKPESMKLEGAYKKDKQYKLRFSAARDTPLELVLPEQDGLFTHQADQLRLLFDYFVNDYSIVGTTIRGFEVDKSLVQTDQNQSQAINFLSLDVYWVTGLKQRYEIKIGTQYDQLNNELSDYVNASLNQTYIMQTLQFYGTTYHSYSTHMAWDLGLYMGWVNEKEDFQSADKQDISYDGFQAKLRTGWEYHSADNKNSLLINITFNLDDLINDPTDGGGLSFQAVF